MIELPAWIRSKRDKKARLHIPGALPCRESRATFAGSALVFLALFLLRRAGVFLRRGGLDSLFGCTRQRGNRGEVLRRHHFAIAIRLLAGRRAHRKRGVLIEIPYHAGIGCGREKRAGTRWRVRASRAAMISAVQHNSIRASRGLAASLSQWSSGGSRRSRHSSARPMSECSLGIAGQIIAKTRSTGCPSRASKSIGRASRMRSGASADRRRCSP